MTKIDIISGFLGAGKTTLIKKLLQEAMADTKVVLIENEFGEIGIDGGFLRESGIEMKEMNSGCICCSLVGDFGTSLKEVLELYQPERILIEPSGVGKLSDVIKAVEAVVEEGQVELNTAAAVVDASKCRMYIKNFGEFFLNQIAHADTIILSRTGKLKEGKLEECVAMIRKHNDHAAVITTPWEQLDGKDILQTMEGGGNLEAALMQEVEQSHRHHHEHHEGCGCHDHEHHHEHHEGCGCHDHEHHHEHHEGCGCHGHEHHHHDEGCGCHGHEHHHHDEGCGCHDHEHHHQEGCGCHDHEGHHHAADVFVSWGMETTASYTREDIEAILSQLEQEEVFGVVLRAKGMVASPDGTWLHFDYVPGEGEVRTGKADVTGKLCVIGSKLQEDRLTELFRG